MNAGVFLLTLLFQLDPGAPLEPGEDSADPDKPGESTSPGDDSAEAASGDPEPLGQDPSDQAETTEPTSVAPDAEASKLQASAPEEPTPSPAPVAGTRSEAEPLSVLSSTIRFKPGKGLVFESADGSFGMAIRSRFQLRHEYFHDPASEPKAGHLLMVRRARLNVVGHMFGEHNKYKLQIAMSPRDIQWGPTGAQRSPVLDAIAEFDHLRDATLSVGQFMVPWNRQRIVSSGDFELIDRSVAQSEFQLDRDIGLQLSSNDVGGWGRLRYLVAVFNGEGRDANDFADAGLLYVGRIEVLPFGDSKSRWDYEEGHLDRDSGPRISFGAAYAYHDHAARDRGVMGSVPSDGGTTNIHQMTADVVLQWAGVSLMGEIYRRDGKREFGDATVEDDAGNEVAAPRAEVREGGGYFVQGGYVLPWIPFGVAARYSQILADKERSSLAPARELGGGPSYYFAAHDFKIQADYFRLFEDEIGVGSDFVRTQLSMGF